MSAGDGSVKESVQTPSPRSRRCSQTRFEAEQEAGLVLICVAAEAAGLLVQECVRAAAAMPVLMSSPHREAAWPVANQPASGGTLKTKAVFPLGDTPSWAWLTPAS